MSDLSITAKATTKENDITYNSNDTVELKKGNERWHSLIKELNPPFLDEYS